MPTPVSVARQCLTQEAANALDEAVAVARRRGHAQTTSLHAVSALLSLPSSSLTDACARARNAAYLPRLQFKALELCLGVSLDRVPSTHLTDNPPVSNSFMAAIKRSQANQRRQPENFHIYNQLSQQSSISCVKVELQNLILSILDDPVVSRVFGEAGFRSSEIKMAILRPYPPAFRYSSQSKVPPLFLCNLSDYSDPGRRGFVFPFSGFPALGDGDENSRRIGEVLGRNKRKNPLLVGVCAYEALKSFTEAVEKRKESVLPMELSRLKIISMANDFSRIISENSDKGSVNLMFREVGLMIEECLGTGMVLNFGDLMVFVRSEELGDDTMTTYVVYQLTKFLQIYGQKVWLIGSVASYETYLKFTSRFQGIEKDWNLELLPITSLRPSMSESFPRSSLMESFIPFGGFFSELSDLRVPSSSSYRHVARCHLCNQKYEDEVIAVSNDAKTRDEHLLSAKITGLQKKWDNICQLLHNSQSVPEEKRIPTTSGFQVIEDKKETTDNNSSNNTEASSNRNKSANLNSCISMDLPTSSVRKQGIHFSMTKGSKNENFLSQLPEKTSRTEDLESSPISAASVTTDLGLGICSSPTTNNLKKPTDQNIVDLPPDLSVCCSTNVGLVNTGNIGNNPVQSSSCSSADYNKQFVSGDFKTLFRALSEKIDWQTEAITIISQTIARCRSRSEKWNGSSLRGDIWFNFDGPDLLGKKRTAIALAEMLYGTYQHLICVDFNSRDGIIDTKRLFDFQKTSDYNVKHRGKTVIDFVAGELRRQPLSVVFLENVNKADFLAQNALSRAICTGKFLDLDGREVSIKNAIFVTTTFSRGERAVSSLKESSIYSEERILKAKGWPVHIRIDRALSKTLLDTKTKDIPNTIFTAKRKLGEKEISEMVKRAANKISNRHLDLNLSAEENELLDIDEGNSDNDLVADNSKAWLKNFLDQVDETVVFKRFDFDALAEKTMDAIKKIFYKVFGSECLLEVDSKVMEQLVAAAYISYGSREMENWVDKDLSQGFFEVKRTYGQSDHSVVKLVSCEGLLHSQEQEVGFCLPPRIILKVDRF